MIDPEILKTLKRAFDSLYNEDEFLRNAAASGINIILRKYSIHPAYLELVPTATSIYQVFEAATALMEREIKALSNKLAWATLHLDPNLIRKLDAIDENSIVKVSVRSENPPDDNRHPPDDSDDYRRPRKPVKNYQRTFNKTQKIILKYLAERDPATVSYDDITDIVGLPKKKYGPRLSELCTYAFGQPLLDRIAIGSMKYFSLSEFGKQQIATIDLKSVLD